MTTLSNKYGWCQIKTNAPNFRGILPLLSKLAGDEGFEPPITGPEPVALPLGQSPMLSKTGVIIANHYDLHQGFATGTFWRQGLLEHGPVHQGRNNASKAKLCYSIVHHEERARLPRHTK